MSISRGFFKMAKGPRVSLAILKTDPVEAEVATDNMTFAPGETTKTITIEVKGIQERGREI